MVEAPYTNREIREKWDDIANALSRIEVQTTTTNGKVAELQKWRYVISGGLAVLTTVFLPIAFMVISAYFFHK